MASNVSSIFNDKKEKFFEVFYDSLNICKTELKAVVVEHCNGDGPWSFSDATIDYKVQEENFPFEVWYYNSYKNLTSVLKGEKEVINSENPEIEKLLDYIINMDKHMQCLQTMLTGGLNEASVAALLTLHYFKPLVPDCCYILDERSQKSIGRCELCKEELQYGDNSFGNSKVWHGHSDILLNRSVINICIEKEIVKFGVKDSFDSEEDTSDLESGDETDHKCQFSGSPKEVNLLKRLKNKTISQAISQTIVNAFSECKKNKSLFNKFIPSFLVTEQDITIILYNCELDILLMSGTFSIWNKKRELEVWSLIKVWLTLNFTPHINSLEFYDMLLENSVKSNFKESVGGVYNIYLNSVERPLKQKEEQKQYYAFRFDEETRKKKRKVYADVLAGFF